MTPARTEGQETPQDVVLLVDDNPTNLQVLFKTLSPQGYKLLVAKDGPSALDVAAKARPSLILLDIMMPGMDGYEVCRRLKADADLSRSAVIFCSALDETQNIVKGLELGAVDYVSKPFQAAEVLARVETHLTVQRLRSELESRNAQLEHELQVAQELVEDASARVEGPLLGESDAIKELRERIVAYARDDGPVLITGPAGAGHEAVARTLHGESSRRNRAFIYVDCLSLGTDPKVELVGKSGSLLNLGAGKQPGKWDLAAGGTLFLDRVDSLPPSAQEAVADRLRSEQRGRDGTSARVIAYARGPHSSLVGDGGLHEKLAEQLTERSLRVPALAERADDLPVLAEHFLRQKAGRLGKTVERISKQSMKQMSKHRWAGNIDELQGVLECAIVAAVGPELEVDDALLDGGERIGRYRLVEKLGEGGMGQVWSAKHELLRRPAAVKLISADALAGPEKRDSLKRFEREALVTATLRSPNTVQMYDFGISVGGDFYYVMELLEGIDLHHLVSEHGALPPERAVWFLKQACRSLAEAHRAGLVHRDIKPPNLFACRVGLECDFLKVLDFGIAKQLDQRDDMNLTGTNIVGSPAFMAPEQVEGAAVDGRTDLYALACVAYWLLAEDTVYKAESTLAMVVAHVQGKPRRLSDLSPRTVPPELEEIVMACLEKDPANRPASAVDLWTALDAVPLDDPWTAAKAEGWWDEHMGAR